MKKVFPLAAAIFITAPAILLLFSMPADVWKDLRPATCLASGCFCEASDENSPVRQMANTLSSFGFVFSGAFMFVRPPHRSRMRFAHAALMGTACIVVGIGSAFYHASLTFIGQFLDVFGMFLLAIFMLVYAIERIWNLRIETTLSLFLAINLSLGWMQAAVPEARRFAFALSLTAALLCEWRYRRKSLPKIDPRPLKFGAGMMAVAYIIWMLDNARLLCYEDSPVQGHAIWHLLGASAAWLLYRYYLSEDNRLAGTGNSSNSMWKDGP
jgi:dihydroceramidase